MREKLAKCAFQLFSSHGFKNVNLDMVCSKAGVTKGSLYWHYKSKRELVLAACSHYYERWHRDVEKARQLRTTPIDQLGEVIRTSTKSCLFDKKSRLFSAELFVLALHDDKVRRGWCVFSESVRDVYVSLIDAVVEEGNYEISTPKQNADWLLSAMEGIKQRAIFEPEICDPAHLESNV
ncbi:MAG: TetR/AcrR family transcriptional regulator [Planctomycetaceae bacterium]|nr:TetR/AcrR family transcriptional regulator [Planctomycetaceae bacterium]